MIGFLRGTSLNASIVVDASGVGWLLSCPFPLTPGEQVELFVTTVVRDDAICLYGFDSAPQQLLFSTLRTVPGLGPSMALSLIASLGTVGLIDALMSKDASALTSCRGVGAKLAAKVVTLVSVPDSLAALASASPAGSGASSQQASVQDPLHSALVDMGVPSSRAASLLTQARSSQGPAAAEQDVLRAALRSL